MVQPTTQTTTAARVSGRLSAVDGRQLISAAVVLSPIDGEGQPVPGQDVVIGPDGTFEFRGVPPGRYQIRARGATGPDGETLSAAFRVVVGARDIANIELLLRPGATLTGTLAVHGAGPATPERPTFEGLRVRAPFADGSSFGDGVSGEVAPDGTFAIRDVMSGSHVITVEGLPGPWVLERVMLRGRDITDSGIDTEGRQTFHDIQVTITDAASEVSGTVRDARGQAVAGAMVVFVPLSRQYWSRASRRFGLTRTGASGRYVIRGLPAGEYRVAASTTVDEAGLFRRGILAEISSLGIPLSLERLDARTLDLTLAVRTAGS